MRTQKDFLLKFPWRGFVAFDRQYGLHFVLRCATAERRAVGFLIKPASAMLFSERYVPERYRHKLRLGPIYMRTFGIVRE